VLESGYIGQGEKVEEFEEKLAQRVGTRNVLTVNSGTSALDLALACLEVGPGDEVISTPMTCSATNHSINNTGATIVWADIDPITGLISPESVTRAITEKTKAVVVVDWGGERVNFRLGLLRRELPVIVDSAHRAIMADDRLEKDGSGRIYIAYSFQAIKFLTTGDGGCLIVPESQYAKCKLMRWFGLDRDSGTDSRCSQEIMVKGAKWHMNDIAAAIGLANLEGLDERVKRHQQIAQFYRDRKIAITGSPDSHSWVAFMHVHDRERFQRSMAKKNIATSLVHSRNDKHPVFENASVPQALSGVDSFSSSYCAIPCGWWLTDAEVEHIAESVLWWKYHTEGAVL
jgi:dTDP-4-amino-4,6-dideoxygalactose transaminase